MNICKQKNIILKFQVDINCWNSINIQAIIFGFLCFCALAPTYGEEVIKRAPSPVWIVKEDSKNLLYDIQNPFAFIPRLPVENQFDFGNGSKHGMSYVFRPRPVLPFELGENAAVVTRTSFNLVYQGAAFEGDSNMLGLGDTDLEFYFTPKKTLAGGKLIVGLGPIFRFPTATRTALGQQKWGIGPAAALIYQPGRVDADDGWTYNFFAAQLFGYAGAGRSDPLSTLAMQPSISYTFAGGTSVGVDLDSLYDWSHGGQWTLPMNLTVSQLMNVGSLPVVFGIGGRYYAVTPAGGPEWGGQMSFNLLFPD